MFKYFIIIILFCDNSYSQIIRKPDLNNNIAIRSSNSENYTHLTIPIEVEESSKNVVRIRIDNHIGGQDRGTGVYLGDIYVATCYHLFRDAPKNGTVIFLDGTEIKYELHHGVDEVDQAILKLDKPHKTLHGVIFSDDVPVKGDIVYSVGLGTSNSNTKRIFGGKIISFLKHSKSKSKEPTYLAHEAAAEYGDSGGPTFNSKGELYGCLKGFSEYNDENVTMTSMPPVFRNMSRNIINNIQNWRNRKSNFRLIR